MFEKPRKAQVVPIKIEVVSLDPTSMPPSLDGPSGLVISCRCDDDELAANRLDMLALKGGITLLNDVARTRLRSLINSI